MIETIDPMEPLDSGYITSPPNSSFNTTTGISQQALTKEFCAVAEVLRNISVTTNESVQVQKNMLQNAGFLLDKMNILLDKTEQTNSGLDNLYTNLNTLLQSIDALMGNIELNTKLIEEAINRINS